jgi:hypothetical protein
MATVKSTQPSAVTKLDDVVDAWFAESVNGTPVSQDTNVYNQLFAAKESLKQRLATALKGE